MLLKKWAKDERRWYISEEKTEKNQNSVTIMISVDERGINFSVKLNCLNQDIKKRILKNLIEISRLTWPLFILFQAITRLKAI